MISGSCLCGAVAYQAQSVHPLVTYCHCNFWNKQELEAGTLSQLRLFMQN